MLKKRVSKHGCFSLSRSLQNHWKFKEIIKWKYNTYDIYISDNERGLCYDILVKLID